MNNLLILIKRIFKYTVLIALCLLVGRMGLNYTGYCYEQRRYLTDQEKIDIVVAEILQNFPASLQESIEMPNGEKITRSFTPKNVTYYQSIKHFLEVNQNCCEVTDLVKFGEEHAGQEIPLSMKFMGMVSSYVRVHHQIRYKYENGEEIVEDRNGYMAISNCGKTRSPITGF